MASKYEMYDNAFFGILQNEGNIETFLDAVFSFLFRKTDFYVTMTSPTDRMGFPPGVAKKHVNAAFKRYEVLAGHYRSQKQTEKFKVKTDQVDAVEKAPHVAHEEEVTTSSEDKEVCDGELANETSTHDKDLDLACSTDGSSLTSSTLPSSTQNSTASADSRVNSDLTVDNGIESESSGVTTEGATSTAPSTASSAAPSVDDKQSDATTAAADGDNPELTVQQKKFQMNPESYNGAIRDNYSWSQSISDVDIHIRVPSHVHRGSAVTVEIARKHLRVAYKDIDGSLVDVVNDELLWDVHKDESMWSLVPGDHVHINLEKVEERWWEAVVLNEPKINVQKIDPSRPITDLDDEAQAKIEELMYNERQKRLGLPQSHEKKVHDLLRQAWDVEGSPFKGQPFDPSIVDVSPGGM